MITILYATTSGSTQLVVEELAHQLPLTPNVVNLRSFAEADASLEGADLVIAGGPTYGTGDWHYNWQDKFYATSSIFTSAKKVALFGLGDARFHGASFCGSIGKLYDGVASLGIHPIGTTSATKYPYVATPSLRNGSFPGFVFDYKLDRRQARAQIADWLKEIL